MSPDSAPPPDQSSAPQVNLPNSTTGPVNVAGRDIVNGTVINVASGGTVVIGEQARQGMQALNEMMQVSLQVRQAVITFSDRFQAATNQVDVMSDYKELHDLLHQIQYQCYATIVREASRFPDETSIEILTEYARNLRDIFVRLQSVASHHRVQPAEAAWIEDVAAAQAELKSATETYDAALLRTAVGRLKSTLATRPVRVNMRLINAAQALNLPALLDALDSIRPGLVELPVEIEKLDSFRAGLLAFKSLNTSLQILLADHEAWQDLDFELRQVENMLEKDLAELEFSWLMLKEKVSPLVQDRQDEWALVLVKYRQSLDEALPTGSPPKIRQAFRNFRHECGSHFYKIDLDLNNLCSELRQVGQPLAAIVRSIA